MKTKYKGNRQQLGKQAIALTAMISVLPSLSSFGIEYDLSAPGTQSVNVLGDVGGTAVVSDFFEQPTGTGVFTPFLTIDGNGQTSTGVKNIEQGYNTDGHNAMYLDQLRPQWNTPLRVSDLATITLNNVNYFGFVLDANEPGNKKSIISIDNIRIYTSAADNTANVGSNTSKLNDLGTLRWAMNDPLQNPNGTFNIDTWIKLDSAQENVEQGSSNSNGGSGKGDMIVYVPQSAFGNSLGTDDYLWFYNLNGVHYDADKNLASEAGFEEWRAITGPQHSVPDGGSSLALFGSALTALGLLGNFRRTKRS